MRLIDADALIPMMKYATIDNEIGVFPIMIGFDAIKEVIDEAPTIDPVQGWIPCGERLPDVGVDVLTTTDWSDVLIAWLNKNGAWETEEHILDNDEIIAWMPLPKPYKGGDSE